MSYFSADFFKAGRPNLVENGFEFIAGPVIRNSDILILSDTNHSKSINMINDLFSPDKLTRYSQAGVTDVYLEELESLDPYARKLERGEIGKEEFIDINMSESYPVHYTDEVYRAILEDTADAIITGSEMDPPVRIHFAQIENTEEQEKELSELQKSIRPPLEEVSDLTNKLVNFFNEQGVELTNSDLEQINLVAKYFSLTGPEQEIIDEIYDFNPYEKLSRQFEGRLTQNTINVSLDDFYNLKWNVEREEAGLASREFDLRMQYRIDNDKILADRIADTKYPQGKAIVVHGAAHGAERKNDLDELLEKKGFSVSRVNVVYGEENDMNPEDGYQDICDADYYPVSGKLEFRDVNSDGRIEGLSRELEQPAIKAVSGMEGYQIK
jgi:hypothetical protein